MDEWIKTENDSVIISVKVFPGSSKNEFAGIRDKRLCIRVTAAPQDNKANACLCEFLAKSLHCPKREIVLINGEKSRIKTIAVPAAYGEKLKEITCSI